MSHLKRLICNHPVYKEECQGNKFKKIPNTLLQINLLSCFSKVFCPFLIGNNTEDSNPAHFTCAA